MTSKIPKILAKKLVISVELARLIIPFTIFINPYFASILSLFLDGIDGQLFFDSGYKWTTYNLLDKIMDFWWYLAIVAFLWHTPVFPIAVVLLAYRSIGQFGSILFKNEKIFLFFPNILEWFFYIHLLFNLHKVILNLLISTVIATTVEWIIHNSRAHILSRYVFHDEIRWKK